MLLFYKYRSIKEKLLLLGLPVFFFLLCISGVEVAFLETEVRDHALLVKIINEEFLRRIVFIVPLFVIVNAGFYFDNNIVQKLISMGMSRKSLFFEWVIYIAKAVSFFIGLYIFNLLLVNYLEGFGFNLPYKLVFVGLAQMLVGTFFYCCFTILLLLIFETRIKSIAFFLVYIIFEFTYSFLIVQKFALLTQPLLPIGVVRAFSISSLGKYKPFLAFGTWQSILLVCYFAGTIFLIYRLVVKKSFPQL
jgi:hypothetical protein